jgi:hypothetical protein
MLHAQIGRRQEIDSWLLVVGSQTSTLLLPITWAVDVQIVNARAFSISTFQDLSNDTKNTPMRGGLPLAIELWTFESPGRLPTSNFSKCWASPPHLAKVGLRHASWPRFWWQTRDCLWRLLWNWRYFYLRMIFSSWCWSLSLVMRSDLLTTSQ